MTMIPELELVWLKSNISFYLRAALITTALAVCLLAGCHEAWAEEISEDIAIQCILGEARGEYAEHGYPAFLAIADALRNRGTVRGGECMGVRQISARTRHTWQIKGITEPPDKRG